jgi:predicted RNase H-like HicB family nuclease
MTSYIGIVCKGTGRDYGVFFPDFPGCVTTGSTLDKAFKMAKEALQFHIDGLIEDNCSIPEPSGYDKLKNIGENAIGLFMVKVKAPLPLKHAA